MLTWHNQLFFLWQIIGSLRFLSVPRFVCISPPYHPEEGAFGHIAEQGLQDWQCVKPLKQESREVVMEFHAQAESAPSLNQVNIISCCEKINR